MRVIDQQTSRPAATNKEIFPYKNYCSTAMLLYCSAVLLLCCASALLVGCQQKQVQIKIGDAPPKFTLPDLKGNKVTVPDEFNGKVLIIRFWADWCTYCAEEMPAIDIVYNKYKERGVIILAVNAGQPKEVAEAFVSSLKISYPVLLDTYSVTAKRYGVVGLPTTFILDRNGVVREKILGETDRESFERMVMGLL